MKITATTLLAVILISQITFAQSFKAGPFFEAAAGGFYSTQENFSEGYGSAWCNSYSLGAGFSVSPKLKVFAKLSVHAKSGEGQVKVLHFDGTGLTGVSYKPADRTFEQKMYNFGFQYIAYQMGNIRFSILAGISNYTVKTTIETSNSKASGEIKSGIIGGVFGGFHVEYAPWKLPLSFTGAVQYDNTGLWANSTAIEFNGISVQAGARYYLRAGSY